MHASEGEILFYEREIWWCSLGVNIGFEQDGTNDLFERPVLVIKKIQPRRALGLAAHAHSQAKSLLRADQCWRQKFSCNSLTTPTHQCKALTAIYAQIAEGTI